jgi:hypothetical protein
MSLDVKQFRQYIVIPALEHIGLHSLAAENLLVGTALQESHLRYLDQLTPGPGPAYGLFQMERRTHDDHWDKFISKDQDLNDKILSLMSSHPTKIEQLRCNLLYAAAMCRVHYRRVKEPLPEASDVEGLGQYWKKYYNTYAGKGTVSQFVKNYAGA